MLPQKIAEWRPTVLPDGRWMLYHQSTRKIHTLSAPAGILWELCDGTTPLASLVRHLSDYYPNVAPGELETQVSAMIQQFTEQELVTIVE